MDKIDQAIDLSIQRAKGVRGDADGDGDRDGSYKDQQQRRKEARKRREQNAAKRRSNGSQMLNYASGSDEEDDDGILDTAIAVAGGSATTLGVPAAIKGMFHFLKGVGGAEKGATMGARAVAGAKNLSGVRRLTGAINAAKASKGVVGGAARTASSMGARGAGMAGKISAKGIAKAAGPAMLAAEALYGVHKGMNATEEEGDALAESIQLKNRFIWDANQLNPFSLEGYKNKAKNAWTLLNSVPDSAKALTIAGRRAVDIDTERKEASATSTTIVNKRVQELRRLGASNQTIERYLELGKTGMFRSKTKAESEMGEFFLAERKKLQSRRKRVMATPLPDLGWAATPERPGITSTKPVLSATLDTSKEIQHAQQDLDVKEKTKVAAEHHNENVSLATQQLEATQRLEKLYQENLVVMRKMVENTDKLPDLGDTVAKATASEMGNIVMPVQTTTVVAPPADNGPGIDIARGAYSP